MIMNVPDKHSDHRQFLRIPQRQVTGRKRKFSQTKFAERHAARWNIPRAQKYDGMFPFA